MTGIVFDIDDTLYNRQELFTDAAGDVLGIKIPDRKEFVRVFYEMSDLNTADLEAGKITTLECNGWRYEETFKTLGLPYKEGDGLKAAEAYYESQGHISLNDGMIRVLDRLSDSEDYKLAVLTAGKSSHQWRKFNMLGLSKWIPEERVIVGGDVGISKPDIKIFRMMEERLGLNPSDIWMIGDSYKHDIEGAMNAGWHTIWIDRRGRTDIEGHPDHTVYSDDELIKVITDVWL